MSATPPKPYKPAPRDGLSYTAGLLAIGAGALGLWLAYEALESAARHMDAMLYNGKFTVIAPAFAFAGFNILIRGPEGINLLDRPGTGKVSTLNAVLLALSMAAGLAIAFYVDWQLRALGYERGSIFS